MLSRRVPSQEGPPRERVGMISTGPDRVQTMTQPGFDEMFS